MAAQSVRVPYQYFTNQDGTALDNGSIYIGVANQNPETNPISTYWDAALTSAASQPISTSAGFPTYQGTPANVYVDEYSYSITVKDSSGRTVYTDPFVANENFLTVTLAELPDVPPSANLVVFLTDAGREGQFICKVGVAPSDPLEGIYVASNTPNFYWERVWDKINGYPEWFGAVYNSNSGSIPATNVAAFQACQTLCSVTNFRRADYWINDTLKLNVPYRTILGWVRSDGYDTGHGTRIISVNASANVIQVGPDTMPGGGTSNFMRNITVQNISAQYGVGITPPSIGNESSAVKHWLVQYVLNCQISKCAAWEPIIGFFFYGAVYTKIVDCQVFRSAVFGGANDFFRGFWPQGAPAILAGGNPSLYFSRCNVSMGGAPALVDPTGFFANGDFADIFVDDLETSTVPNGVWVTGVGASGTYGKLDLHLRNVVIDQCNGTGILINALNNTGMVTISGGYIQINDTGAGSKGIWVTGSGNAGSVSIDGGTQIISQVGTSNTGVYISGQSNVSIDNTIIIEDFFYPIAIDGASEQCDIAATITNPNTGNGSSAAISVNNATRLRIACKVDGGSAKFAQGILSVSTTTSNASFDPTLFNPAAISGGAANKILLNSIQITLPGYYTTAGASGTSGAGIFVTGITA
jgi:hypothetical protein